MGAPGGGPVAGCAATGGGGSASAPGGLPNIAAQKKLGGGEGKLNIIGGAG